MTSLMEYFNRQPRIGALATADRNGRVDVAVMGSPRMVDEQTVMLGAGNNRSLANLRENPNAVFIIVEPAGDPLAWKGVRVYLRLRDLAESGPAHDAFVNEFVRAAGEGARSMIHAVATFDVAEVRPLLDMGQGWEKSV